MLFFCTCGISTCNVNRQRIMHNIVRFRRKFSEETDSRASRLDEFSAITDSHFWLKFTVFFFLFFFYTLVRRSLEF